MRWKSTCIRITLASDSTESFLIGEAMKFFKKHDPLMKQRAKNTDAYWVDGVVFWTILILGVVAIFLTPSGEARQWFILPAALLSLVFVLVYSRRPWRTTYAGRAVMISTAVTTIYSTQAAIILWYPSHVYGYQGWQNVQEFIYLLIALAMGYKLRAVTRESRPDNREDEKP